MAKSQEKAQSYKGKGSVEAKIVIIKLGGSVISGNTDLVDVDYLKEFRQFILSYLTKGWRFVLIAGGGKVVRRYVEHAKNLGVKEETDLHQIGVEGCRLNAELLRSLFGNLAHSRVWYELGVRPEWTSGILVVGAWKPGYSTDEDAIIAARAFRSSRVIKLTDVDYLYSADPDDHADAERIEDISWKEYDEVISEGRRDHKPAKSAPVDVVAARRASSAGLDFLLINGRNLTNLAQVLEGKEFIGTVIHP